MIQYDHMILQYMARGLTNSTCSTSPTNIITNEYSNALLIHVHPSAGNWIHLDIGCGTCSQQISTLHTAVISFFIVVSCFNFLLGSQYYLRCYDDLLTKVRVDFDTQCRSLKKSASLFQMLAKVTWAFYLLEFRSHHVKRKAWKIATLMK